MANLYISGIGSGIDWRSIVDATMNVERVPISRWTSKQQTLNSAKAAWMSLRTSLATLDSKLEALNSESIFDSKMVTSSNGLVFSASASSGALDGEYLLGVTHTALAHVIASDAVGNAEAPLGLSGTFSINGEQVTVTEEDSLKDIAISIGEASCGASASVIDGRLVLKALETGEANAIGLVDDVTGILVTLGLLVDNEGNLEVKHELTSARNALFSLDGLEIERSSNVVSDVLEGITLTLKGDGSATLSVRADYTLAIAVFRDFVDAYNSFVNKASQDSGRDGVLRGDPALSRLCSALRTLATAPLEGFESPYKALYEIGISTSSKSPVLHLDESALGKALQSDPDAVKRLFHNPAEGVEGIAELLRSRITASIDDREGSITLREERLDREISDLQWRIDSLEVRLAKREEYLVRKFTAMESAMNQLQIQSNWLSMWSLSVNGHRPGN